MAATSTPSDPLRAVFKDLQDLRGGLGLRGPQPLLACGETFHQVTGMVHSALGDAQRIQTGMLRLMAAIDELDRLPREIALVEFNLHEDHNFSDLDTAPGFPRCRPRV